MNTDGDNSISFEEFFDLFRGSSPDKFRHRKLIRAEEDPLARVMPYEGIDYATVAPVVVSQREISPVKYPEAKVTEIPADTVHRYPERTVQHYPVAKVTHQPAAAPTTTYYPVREAPNPTYNPYQTPARHEEVVEQDYPRYSEPYQPRYNQFATPAYDSYRQTGMVDPHQYRSSHSARGYSPFRSHYNSADPGHYRDYDPKTTKDHKPLYKHHVQVNPHMSPLKNS